jgi:hypothetical protein
MLFLLFSTLPSIAERPEVADWIKGDKEVSTKVIALMEKLAVGEATLLYTSSAGYGDGGSTGTYLQIDKNTTLVVFSPWWKAGWKEVRLGISKEKDGVPDWSLTIEQDPKLKESVISTFKIITDTTSKPVIEDQQTLFHIKALLKSIDRNEEG